ncbi:patatin-like phospholipase family protein [Dermacoccaceae bacterium W4C1]
MVTAPRTAFVLGGGGVLGATQVGMMRALQARGITADLVLGTSIGAINGAFYAADPTEAGLRRLSTLWEQMAAARGWPELTDGTGQAPRRRRVRPPRPRGHLYPAGAALRALRSALPIERLEQTAVEFQCVAAGIETASATWFSSGPAAPAILASCAVPGLFPPIEIEGRHYLDGGLVHSIPLGRAVTLGAERIFVLHVGRVEQPLRTPRWPWQVAQTTFEIARRHRYIEESAQVPDGVQVFALPSGSDDAPLISLLHRNPDYVRNRVEAAAAASEAFLTEALA